MLTEIIQDGVRTVTCQCGWTRKTHWPLEQLHHTCTTGPCQHLGAEARVTPCAACKGTVQLKVFSCQLHTEATLRKKVEGVACCLGCKDFSSTP